MEQNKASSIQQHRFASVPKQQTLEKAFKRKEKLTRESKNAKEITEKVVKVIILNKHATS